MASQIRATASGALSAMPAARCRRASSAALKISSRSSSHGVKRMAEIVVRPEALAIEPRNDPGPGGLEDELGRDLGVDTIAWRVRQPACELGDAGALHDPPRIRHVDPVREAEAHVLGLEPDPGEHGAAPLPRQVIAGQ